MIKITLPTKSEVLYFLDEVNKCKPLTRDIMYNMVLGIKGK